MMPPHTSDFLHPIGVQKRTTYSDENTKRIYISGVCRIPEGCNPIARGRRPRGPDIPPIFHDPVGVASLLPLYIEKSKLICHDFYKIFTH